MTAACVRPLAARVILRERSALEEQAIPPIDEHHGKRAMQLAGAVRIELRREPDFVVVLVDEDDELLGIVQSPLSRACTVP